MVAAAVIGGVATVAGAAMASDASRSAGNKMADATRDSNSTQKYMYDQTREDNMPALESRNWALGQLRSMLGDGGMNRQLSANDVMTEAGYQFGLNQGLTSLNRQAASKGMLNSGAALKAAARYGNDYATTKYNDSFNRLETGRNNTVNRLNALATGSQVGTSQIAGAGTNYANAVSGNQTALGNAQAAAGLTSAGAWSNAGNQLAGWYGNYARNNNTTTTTPNALQSTTWSAPTDYSLTGARFGDS